MAINPLFAVMANLPTQLRAPSTSDEYPNALRGLYSDNIIVPSQVMDTFLEQIVKPGLQPITLLSQAFLSESNVEYIRQQIENNLRDYTGEDNIRFLLTKEFAQDMVDRVYNNPGLAWDVKVGVPLLNDLVIHRETQIAELSLREEKRYTRWALHNDRLRVMPYGLGDKTLHVHGENQVSPSGYELNHPFKSQYVAYLKDVLHINCPSLSTQPCKMPSFPIKYATP